MENNTNMEENIKDNSQNIPDTNTNTNKNELIQNIKEWISLDNEISKLKLEAKNKTARKKELTNSLIQIMKSNSIDCFDINGGSLIYKEKKTPKTISSKYLLEQLNDIYKDTPDIALEIKNKVWNNRIKNVKGEITRKVNK